MIRFFFFGFIFFSFCSITLLEIKWSYAETSESTYQDVGVEKYRRKRKKRKSSDGSTSSRERPRRPRASDEFTGHARVRKERGEVIDLSTMSSETPSSSGTPAPKDSPNSDTRGYDHEGSTIEPNFKMYFDFMLTRKPGITPLTFDNYHTIFMVDFIPKPDVQFGFEVSPTPRYYELDYDLTESFQIRVGRIWIPFDAMDPHNVYGGWINTSQLIHPGGTAFLPDIWTDLGVGIRYRPVDSKSLSLDMHMYVVNGFTGGASDPAGKAADYPDFSTIQKFADNNGDKAVGARVHLMAMSTLGLGASVYTCRWTDDDVKGGVTSPVQNTARILAAGIDAQLNLGTGSVLRAGYIGMNVGLPAPADKGFNRGAVYGELSHRFLQKWRILFRGGTAQNDNRVIDVTDKTLVGAALYHHFNPMFTLGAEHYRDINKVATKFNYSFTALRLSMTL